MLRALRDIAARTASDTDIGLRGIHLQAAAAVRVTEGELGETKVSAQYEIYLSFSDWELLNAHRAELSSSLRVALSVAKFDFEKADHCCIFPDIAAMVEIARILNYIPRHYHTPLAAALRADGWKKEGRITQLEPNALAECAECEYKPCDYNPRNHADYCPARRVSSDR